MTRGTWQFSIALLCLTTLCAGAQTGQTTTPAPAAAPTQTQPPPHPQTRKKSKELIDPDATAGVRGTGLPVIIRVRRHGHPVPKVEISIKTEDGVVIRSGETDGAGNFTLKLDPGDYTITAATERMERHLFAHVAATVGAGPARFTIQM